MKTVRTVAYLCTGVISYGYKASIIDNTYVAPAMNISTVLALVTNESNAMKTVVPKKEATIRGTSRCMLSTAITGMMIVSPRKHDIIDLLTAFAQPSGRMKMRASWEICRRRPYVDDYYD